MVDIPKHQLEFWGMLPSPSFRPHVSALWSFVRLWHPLARPMALWWWQPSRLWGWLRSLCTRYSDLIFPLAAGTPGTSSGREDWQITPPDKGHKEL